MREIKLTEPKEDAFVAKTLYSSISTGTDMKTYKGMQHPEKYYSEIKDRVAYAHFKDFKALNSGHIKPSFCGDSDMDWKAILDKMNDFEGFCLFEYENTEDISYGLEKSHKYIKELI